ncbi:zinc ribbon domain-containing protein [Sulfobacillus acidophilus]|uniref:Zinc ribbon domain-containing protein n=1 Tax=Sulfobacillus acidophilus TaxID=53633 RepID=A0ABS3B0L0_9FIRM|nr:zinc ribbon domain-containing protein [Sulfobacillus acidophilus]
MRFKVPIYEFYCKSCKNTQEILQKVSDKDPTTCSSCGKKQTLKKLVSQTSFHLKGGGWYKDLYSSVKNDAKSTKVDKKAPSSNQKKSKGKKPEKQAN